MFDHLHHFLQNYAGDFGVPLEYLVRLILAAVAGGLIGMEREFRGRQAGLRTNMLVCVGSCLAMIVSIHAAYYQWPVSSNFNITVDPSRIAYGVMTGVGFLGAGTIIQQRGEVRGLTTAAAIWCVAGLGLALGGGMYIVALETTLLILLALWLLGKLEHFMPRTQHRLLKVRVPWSEQCVQQVIEHVRAAGREVIDAQYQRIGDLTQADIDLHFRFPRREDYFEFERKLAAKGITLICSRQEP